MYPAGSKVGLVNQAVKNLDKEHIDKVTCLRIQKFLVGTSKQELIKNLKYAPLWIRTLILSIMETKS